VSTEHIFCHKAHRRILKESTLRHGMVNRKQTRSVGQTLGERGKKRKGRHCGRDDISNSARRQKEGNEVFTPEEEAQELWFERGQHPIIRSPASRYNGIVFKTEET